MTDIIFTCVLQILATAIVFGLLSLLFISCSHGAGVAVVIDPASEREASAELAAYEAEQNGGYNQGYGNQGYGNQGYGNQGYGQRYNHEQEQENYRYENNTQTSADTEIDNIPQSND